MVPAGLGGINRVVLGINMSIFGIGVTRSGFLRQ